MPESDAAGGHEVLSADELAGVLEPFGALSPNASLRAPSRSNRDTGDDARPGGLDALA